jgi:Xaa-Pro aminopeptidase
MITLDEYRARQAAFAASLATAGLAGALVVSRGGATADRYASVLYLTGHYQSYSYLPDAPGLFSARAHTALAIRADGACVLCVSVPEHHGVVADHVRHGDDFSAAVAGALADLGLSGGLSIRLGLVGEDVLPLRVARALPSGLDLVPCDALLEALRRRKSPAEQALIREAAAIHRRGTDALLAALQPGVTEAEALAALAASVTAAGAGLYFTSVSSGETTSRWTSVAQPGFSRRMLRAGDLLRFDVGIVWQGYLSDFGRTAVIGSPNAAQRHLLDTLHAGLDAAIGAVRPGASVRDVVLAGEAVLARAPDIESSFPVHWGHGLGLGWEGPYLTAAEEAVLEPDMYLAIERTLSLPGTGTAAAEQTLLVTQDGAEVLTAGAQGRWR